MKRANGLYIVTRRTQADWIKLPAADGQMFELNTIISNYAFPTRLLHGLHLCFMHNVENSGFERFLSMGSESKRNSLSAVVLVELEISIFCSWAETCDPHGAVTIKTWKKIFSSFLHNIRVWLIYHLDFEDIFLWK